MKPNILSEKQRKLLIWLSPFIGAFLTAVVMTIRLALCTGSGYLSPRDDFFLGFLVWFVRDSLVNLVFVLPLLLFARWLGLRHSLGFVLLAALATYPVGYYISDPNNVFSPTEGELEHGIYWDSVIPYVLIASTTGWFFARGTRPNNALQRTEAGGTLSPSS